MPSWQDYPWPPRRGDNREPQTLPPFWKSRLSEVDAAVAQVQKGRVRVLAQSAGHRNIHLVTYGESNESKSTANYNSACAGGDPASYARKDGRQKPVVFLLGPVHGAELEGIVGLVNLLRVAETGKDQRGRAWEELAANLSRCRVLVVPVGNPDGRARCAFDSWVGQDLAIHERVSMGVKPDGSSYEWPSVKRIHPMRGAAVGILGAYFNDDGVNLMHDDWFDPMGAETRAYLRLRARSRPISSYRSTRTPASPPSSRPRTCRARSERSSGNSVTACKSAIRAMDLPHRTGGPKPIEDGVSFPPPSFNLCSALHHACGGVSFVHECSAGVTTAPYPLLTHEQLLDLQLLFFDELFRFAVAHPINWLK